MKYFIILISVSLLFLMPLSSCSTSGKVTVDENSTTISVPSSSDLSKHGRSYQENPFMAPVSLIRGRLNEFIVLKLTINSISGDIANIEYKASDGNGKDSIKLVDQKALIDYWDRNTAVSAEEDRNWNGKIIEIQRMALPSFNFKVQKGISEFYLVFIGEKSIIRPAMIEINILYQNVENYNYIYELKI